MSFIRYTINLSSHPKYFLLRHLKWVYKVVTASSDKHQLSLLHLFCGLNFIQIILTVLHHMAVGPARPTRFSKPQKSTEPSIIAPLCPSQCIKFACSDIQRISVHYCVGLCRKKRARRKNLQLVDCFRRARTAAFMAGTESVHYLSSTLQVCGALK